jgi:Thymidylate kinase
MTRARRQNPAKAQLIAVDGVDAAAVIAAAKEALGAPSRGGISKWDASGVFQDLAVADRDAGAPSARTLLLLYAADLAFRLRWQIRPALAEGRTVIAAPYLATGMALGRAAGLPSSWVMNLFRFAPRPDAAIVVHGSREGRSGSKDGFVGFVCDRIARSDDERFKRQLIEATAARLRVMDRKHRKR